MTSLFVLLLIWMGVEVWKKERQESRDDERAALPRAALGTTREKRGNQVKGEKGGRMGENRNATPTAHAIDS